MASDSRCAANGRVVSAGTKQGLAQCRKSRFLSARRQKALFAGQTHARAWLGMVDHPHFVHILGAMQGSMQPATIPQRSSTAIPSAGRQAVTAEGGGGAVGFAIDRGRAAASLSKPPDVLLPTEKARRVAALVLLLEGFHELRDSLRGGDGDTFRDGGLLLAPHESDCRLLRRGSECTCVLSGVAELERLLQRMRFEQPRLRFHVVAYFVDAEQRGRWEPRKARRRRPWQPYAYRRFVVRDARADKALAVEGVGWLAERWDLRDVRGELVNPWLVAPGVDNATFARLTSVHSPPLRSAST